MFTSACPAAVIVTGWAPSPPTVAGSAAHDPTHDAATGVWTVAVDVPSRGWAAVDVRA